MGRVFRCSRHGEGNLSLHLTCGLFATDPEQEKTPLLEFCKLLYILTLVYPDTETITMATKKGSKKVSKKKTKKKAAKKKR
jgi:hypothetical protein